MRMCLADKIKNEDFDANKTIRMVESIIDELPCSIDGRYLSSVFCTMARSFSDARFSIRNHNNNDQIDTYLDYCELVLSIVKPYYNEGYNYRQVFQIISMLENGLSKIGWGINYNEEKNCYICFRKNIEAEIVASVVSKSCKEKIYDYLSIREGENEQKRSVLKDLIDEIDTYCKTKSEANRNLKKFKHFYQCVRHPQDDPVREYPFYYDDEEKWMNNIFLMIIDVLAYMNLEKLIKEIIEKEKGTL